MLSNLFPMNILKTARLTLRSRYCRNRSEMGAPLSPGRDGQACSTALLDSADMQIVSGSTLNSPLTTVPETSSLLFMGSGSLGMGGVLRRRKDAKCTWMGTVSPSR